MILDEHDFDCAAAQGLDPNRTGPCEKIDEARSGNVRAQHIEERFAQTVAGGPKCGALEAPQDAAAVGSSDDAHEYTY